MSEAEAEAERITEINSQARQWNEGPDREQVMQPAARTLAREHRPAHTSLHFVGNTLALKRFEIPPDLGDRDRHPKNILFWYVRCGE